MLLDSFDKVFSQNAVHLKERSYPSSLKRLNFDDNCSSASLPSKLRKSKVFPFFSAEISSQSRLSETSDGEEQSSISESSFSVCSDTEDTNYDEVNDIDDEGDIAISSCTALYVPQEFAAFEGKAKVLRTRPLSLERRSNSLGKSASSISNSVCSYLSSFLAYFQNESLSILFYYLFINLDTFFVIFRN